MKQLIFSILLLFAPLAWGDQASAYYLGGFHESINGGYARPGFSIGTGAVDLGFFLCDNPIVQFTNECAYQPDVPTSASMALRVNTGAGVTVDGIHYPVDVRADLSLGAGFTIPSGFTSGLLIGQGTFSANLTPSCPPLESGKTCSLPEPGSQYVTSFSFSGPVVINLSTGSLAPFGPQFFLVQSMQLETTPEPASALLVFSGVIASLIRKRR